MGSMNQDHVFGRRESSFRQRARSMALHRGMQRDSATLARSENCCESSFLRNTAGVTGNLGTSACHSPSCGHSCQSNINYRTSGHFHERVPVYDGHTEGGPRVVNRGQAPHPFRSGPRGAVRSSCNCGVHMHGPERCEESDVHGVDENRCYHRGASTADAQEGHGHSHAVDDCGHCCLSRPATHLGRDEGGYSFDNRLRGTGGSPCFPVTEEFSRQATANGFVTKPLPMPREATTIASRTDSTSVANVLVPTQASKEQVIFYGWFLKRPTVKGMPACSTLPQVAIGGYKSAGLIESDYCETGPIVQRLERWRLRTSDGVDVGLLGMLNVTKSVENGFPFPVVKCFMLGFPNVWIPLIANLCTVAPRSCNFDLPSSPGSPSNAHGQTQDTQEYGKVPLTPLSLEEDPVNIILSSSLFLSPGDTRVRSLHRVSPTNNAVRSGIVSDATSVPQPSGSREDLDKSRNDDDSCYDAINSGNQFARYEPKVPELNESAGTEPVFPEGGAEHPASPGHGIRDNGNPVILKEESSREGGIEVLPTRETSLNEQAPPNIDWGEFLGYGNPKGKEDEARERACDEVNIRQDTAVVMEAIAKECACAIDSGLKFPSCSGEVGLDGARFPAGDSQDRESKADEHVKDSSNEELSSGGEKTAKHSARASKDLSDTSRKRPFQEVSPVEEAERQSKVMCGKNSSNGVPAGSTSVEGSSGFLPEPLTSGRSDAGLTHDSIPCTPLQECKKRPRSATETPGVDLELRGEGAFNYNSEGPISDTRGSEQVGEDKIDVVFATPEDLTVTEPKDCKRPKKSACSGVISCEIHVSGEESMDVGVELITEAAENEITNVTEDVVVDETTTGKGLMKDEGNAVLFGQPERSVGEYNNAEPKDDASVDAQKLQSTISPENVSLPASATRRRGRTVVTPPSSELGKVSSAAQGIAVIGFVCLDGVGKESDGVLKSDRELDNVGEAEHVCKGEGKDVITPTRKYHRKPRIRYYKGRRRRSVKRDSFVNGHCLDPNSTPDCKSTAGAKSPEGGKDERAEKSQCENKVPVRLMQLNRATKRSETSRGKSDGQNSETLGDGSGNAAESKSHKDRGEHESGTKSSTRWRKTADRCSSPADKSPSKRCASKQGVEDSKPQTSRMKLRSSIVPPPPPPPRVVDKTMVPEAFGLKKSRHGRVLVPRLAAWLNQSIKYDMDGGIIAISEGFQGGDEEFGTGRHSFKPPYAKDAVSMQRKLRNAAELS